MGFLPKHYAESIDEFGKFHKGTEPKIEWKKGENGKYEFIFQSSFNEMLDDFKAFHPELCDRKIPSDWTLYYLRKKALTHKISKEELAWIMLNFNQKRGYYQLRGEEDDIDTSKITDMSSVFKNLDPHNIDISEWNVSNVTNMQHMFKDCEHFNCDLNRWDVSNVKNMKEMFYGCSKFNSELNNWNVSKVIDMSYMFKLCKSFNSDIGNWDIRKVKDMSGMFSYSSFDRDISKWLPKSLKWAAEIYYKCPLDFHDDKHFIK